MESDLSGKLLHRALRNFGLFTLMVLALRVTAAYV